MAYSSSLTDKEWEIIYRKVWRQELEVAMKVKGSQGNKRVESVKPEHPYTAISSKTEVHANHNEAHKAGNAQALCFAYQRRTNTYAKDVNGCSVL